MALFVSEIAAATGGVSDPTRNDGAFTIIKPGGYAVYVDAVDPAAGDTRPVELSARGGTPTVQGEPVSGTQEIDRNGERFTAVSHFHVSSLVAYDVMHDGKRARFRMMVAPRTTVVVAARLVLEFGAAFLCFALGIWNMRGLGLCNQHWRPTRQTTGVNAGALAEARRAEGSSESGIQEYEELTP